MQLSQIPTQVPLPFAANGTKNTIPEASQIGVTPGAASLNDGFPPLTFTPLAAGGVPPSGADFNGILNLLSQNTQWQNAGGFFPYSASFSTAIGGYPKTALLAKASGLGFWLNLEDNNETDPDTGGAGWIAFDPWAIQAGQFTTAKDTGAANAYAIALTPVPAALTPGMMVGIQSVGNTNTGAATLAVNGLSTLPILLGKGTALTGGELVAGYGALLRLNYAGTAWEMIWTGAGEFVPPATQSNAAVQMGQIDVVPFGTAAISSGTSLTATTGSFTAPCNGRLIILSAAQSVGTVTNLELSASLGTPTYLGSSFESYSGFGSGYLPMNSGQSTTVSSTVTISASNGLTVSVSCFWQPSA